MYCFKNDLREIVAVCFLKTNHLKKVINKRLIVFFFFELTKDVKRAGRKKRTDLIN